MSSTRCSECGERIINPVYEDGKPYCLYCALGIYARKRIDEVLKRGSVGQNIISSGK